MERELKLGLRRQDYLRLLSFARSRSKLQTNVYFEDSKGTLKKAQAGLRIRIENGRRAVLTLKISPKGGTGRGGWHERLEFERRIPLAPAKAIASGRSTLSTLDRKYLKDIHKHFPALSLRSLRRLGTIHTARRLMNVAGHKGELDYWVARGKHYYELEVETSRPAAARRAIAALFREHQIPLRPRRATKLAVLARKPSLRTK